jgi:hypothetical protein
MPRRTPQSQGDQPLQVDLDTGFVGVNDRLDPSLLRSGAGFANGQEPAGLVSAALNNRFISSQAETRPATVQPIHFNPSFGGLLGAGIYSDPLGREWMAVGTPNKVWLLADRCSRQEISLPDGVVLAGYLDATAKWPRVNVLEFTQAFGELILWRGRDLEPLHWNGDQNRGFYLSSAPPPDLANPEAPRFLSPTPPGEYGIVAADRLWVVTGRDTIAWSDLLDWNAFDLSLNTARLNSGEDDQITALFPIEQNLIVWKSQSIFILSGITGDLTNLAAQQLNRNIGCLARRSVAQVGSDVIWLAEGGVYRLSQTNETRLTSNAVPISDAIENTMKRINWLAASGACGTVHGRYYYLAVPLDNAQANNAILVYDTVSGYWQGIDTFPVVGLACMQMLQTDLYGRRVPFLIDWSGGSRIIAMDQPGLCDRRRVRIFGVPGSTGTGTATPDIDISWSLTTRGYTLGEAGLKQLRNVTAATGTQGAETRVSLVGEGPGETRTLSDWRSYSRTNYTRHGLTPFDPINTTDTFNSPYREDYSIVAGDGTSVGNNGLPLYAPQHWVQAYPLRQQVRWLAFTFESRKGRCTLKTVSADGIGESNLATRRN